VIGIATLPTEAFSNNHEALTKLRDVRKGLEDAPAERIDRPRGYGFEFATAAMLHKAGAFGGFERYGDVMQTPGWHPWECKRVGSLTAVSARVREGRGQLKEARRRGISSGIIALDLTRPLRQEFPTLTAKTDARL